MNMGGHGSGADMAPQRSKVSAGTLSVGGVCVARRVGVSLLPVPSGSMFDAC